MGRGMAGGRARGDPGPSSRRLSEWAGLEPATFRLAGERSIQLSYHYMSQGW
jgi:hypothetical protein